MRTTIIARRYLPLAAALGVLLLIIAIFPSTRSSQVAAGSNAPTQGFSQAGGASTDGGASSGAAGASGAGATGAVSGAAGGGAATGGGSAAASGGSAGGGSGATAGGSGATAGGGSAAGGSAAAGGKAGGATPAANSSAQSGDTTHCVGGREFDPAIDFYAPPCTPGTPGAALPNNGGGTAQGVSANTIEVVWFATNYGAVVNAILQAEGLYETAGNIQVEAKAFTNFINTKYVMWGRKINVDVFNSGCTAAPPDTQCLNGEIDTIQAKFHPYALIWDTTVCSSCYAEMAKDGIIGIGGFGFTDSFSNALAPYFYSPGESSTRVATAFAQFYCNQLASNPVQFAGDSNPAQDFNGKPRSLGVITPNDPDNINSVEKVLEPALDACGAGNQVRQHHYYYSQDPSRTAIESQQAISAMGNTSTTPATTVLCLCDPVAPAFTYGREQNENYWPEAIIASDQGMDDDIIGRSYESGTGCTGSPCEFDRAFGLSTIGPQLPAGQDPGYKVYAAGGGSGQPPVTALTADRDWGSIEILANMIENTGPNLTAARMQAAAPSLGIRGGGTTGMAALGFAANDWQATQDARIVYFDKAATSGYDGQKGAYVQEAGTPRYNLGQYPKTSGNPNIPAKR